MILLVTNSRNNLRIPMRDIKRTQQALETAIRGVEEFSKQQAHTSAQTALPQTNDAYIAPPMPHGFSPPELIPQFHSSLEVGLEPYVDSSEPTRFRWPSLGRTAAIAATMIGIFVAVQQRESLLSLARDAPSVESKPIVEERGAPTQANGDSIPVSQPVKRAPLLPSDYGVYATGNDALFELNLLPGRPLDIRVAVSAAFKMPSRTILPNGHPRFIIFRRDSTSNIADRAEVRMIARIARDFSTDIIGKTPVNGDDTWVVRNISFPFRSSPINGSPEMYELHSEDPALELTPGRYALVLKTQAYDFSIEGLTVDPRQCIERIVASNGTFYSDCKMP
jgi:hypothetical protein